MINYTLNKPWLTSKHYFSLVHFLISQISSFFLNFKGVLLFLFLLKISEGSSQTPVLQCSYPDELQWFCEYITPVLRYSLPSVNISLRNSSEIQRSFPFYQNHISSVGECFQKLERCQSSLLWKCKKKICPTELLKHTLGMNITKWAFLVRR